MKTWLKPIKRLRACGDALEWADHYDSLAEAWAACERGDWMLWLVGRLAGPPESESRRKLVLATCDCARLALKYVSAGEDRPRKAIETAEAWARGEANITLKDVRAYAADAADAADAAYAAWAAEAAAYAAADAADAAYADDAAWAAEAAAYAAAADARAKVLKECADIVRKHYPEAPVLKEQE